MTEECGSLRPPCTSWVRTRNGKKDRRRVANPPDPQVWCSLVPNRPTSTGCSVFSSSHFRWGWTFGSVGHMTPTVPSSTSIAIIYSTHNTRLHLKILSYILFYKSSLTLHFHTASRKIYSSPELSIPSFCKFMNLLNALIGQIRAEIICWEWGRIRRPQNHVHQPFIQPPFTEHLLCTSCQYRGLGYKFQQDLIVVAEGSAGRDGWVSQPFQAGPWQRAIERERSASSQKGFSFIASARRCAP